MASTSSSMCIAPISVLCRPRPPREEEDSGGFRVEADKSRVTLVKANSLLHFSFDYIFDVYSLQSQVFEICGEPMIESMFSGYNSSILAYGQTGSGKTYTITGGMEDLETRGLAPRIVSRIFECIAEASESKEFSVKLSFCEIYMERLTDLLDPLKTNLKLREDKKNGVSVAGITEKYAAEEEELLGLIALGNSNRHIGGTQLNEQSSRSHAVLMLTLTENNIEDGTFRTGKMHFVDLAGAESAGKAQISGKRLDEAKLINKSLTTLGVVVRALADGEAKHIQYRDSKLTRLLQDALGGNSRTMMLITCSPDSSNLEETINSFRFATKAKEIRTHPKENKETTISELRILLARTEMELSLKTRQLEYLEQSTIMDTTSIPVQTQEEPEGEDKDNTMIQENERLQMMIDDLQNQLADVISQRMQLQEENRTLQERCLTAEHSVLSLTTANVQSHNDKLKLSEELLDRDEQIQVLTRARDSLSLDLAETKTNCSKLEMKILELTHVLEAHALENPRLTEIIEQKETEIKALQTKLDETEASLRSALLKSFIGIAPEQYTEDIAKYNEEVLKAHTQLAILQNALNDRDKALAGYFPDYEMFKKIGFNEATVGWETTRVQLQQDLDDRIQKVIRLEIEVDEAHESYHRLCSQLHEAQSVYGPRVSDLESALEKLTVNYQRLVSERCKYQVRTEVLEKKMKRKNEKMKEMETRVKMMEDKLTEAAQTLERRSLEVSQLRLHSPYARSVMTMSSSKIKKFVKGGKVE